MRVASFFSGIGGFDLGLERVGMKVVFQCEISEFCRSVLRQHWPNVEIHGDIRTLKADGIPEAEIWTGGFPCQDVSSANQGKRLGLSGERSGLFYEFKALVEKRLPRWVILENVPGLLNSHQGKDFEILVRSLDELGYGVSWRVFDAKNFGTPQRRRRVYIVASLGSLRSAHVLFDSEATAVPTKSRRGPQDPSAERAGGGNKFAEIFAIQHAGIGRKPEAGPQGKGYRNDGETYTLDSRGSPDAVCSASNGFRVGEAAGVSSRLDRSRYRALGNAVCVQVVSWIGRRVLEAEQQL